MTFKDIEQNPQALKLWNVLDETDRELTALQARDDELRAAYDANLAGFEALRAGYDELRAYAEELRAAGGELLAHVTSNPTNDPVRQQQREIARLAAQKEQRVLASPSKPFEVMHVIRNERGLIDRIEKHTKRS